MFSLLHREKARETRLLSMFRSFNNLELTFDGMQSEFNNRLASRDGCHHSVVCWRVQKQACADELMGIRPQIRVGR